jgi:hypothetical protein
VAGLTFQLAADVIRTFPSFFLDRELESTREVQHDRQLEHERGQGRSGTAEGGGGA